MVQHVTPWTPPTPRVSEPPHSQRLSTAEATSSSGSTARESPVDPLAPMIRRVGTRVEARHGATLPERCVCCGDTVDLRSFGTLRGRLRYSICRDHCVSVCARLAVAALMVLIAGWSLAMPVLSGHRPDRSTLLAFGAVGLAGVVIGWFALPVRVGRQRDGWRPIACAGKDALGELPNAE